MPKGFRRVIGYGLIALGMMGVMYGFSEYMYAIKSSQMILGKIIEMKPSLFNDPTYQAIINLAISQSTTMAVSTYIAPGFILSALGFVLLYINKVIEHFEGLESVVGAVVEGFLGDDAPIVLTEEVENEKRADPNKK